MPKNLSANSKCFYVSQYNNFKLALFSYQKLKMNGNHKKRNFQSESESSSFGQQYKGRWRKSAPELNRQENSRKISQERKEKLVHMVTKENFRIKDVFYFHSDRLGAHLGSVTVQQKRFLHTFAWISVAKMGQTKRRTLGRRGVDTINQQKVTNTTMG